MRTVNILGGGPAGAAAALAARQEGANAQVFEKSKFPRHKVCGEFFSPEIAGELEQLGVWTEFLAAGPARVTRTILHFGSKEKTSKLSDPAWGLSRYRFDRLLLDRVPVSSVGQAVLPPVIVATGRPASPTRRGQRLFGFKAHFEGPAADAVELFFFGPCYVGVSAIEEGRTNVCGLAPEDYLGKFDFEFDAVVSAAPPLRDRLRLLRRVMPWISTGPLEYKQTFETSPDQYPAGDALSFVDPFTGSGLLAAIRSGAMAGRAAARWQDPVEYLAECRTKLAKPFHVAQILRKAVENGWADRLAPFAPTRMLFALTRPR